MSNYEVKKGGIPSKNNENIVTDQLTIQSGGIPQKKDFSFQEGDSRIESGGVPGTNSIFSKEKLKNKINASEETIDNRKKLDI